MRFSGFESAALYAPEARDPKRTVAVATYATVAILTLLLAFSTWVIIGAVGVDEVRTASLDSYGNIVFELMGAHAPAWVSHVVSYMMLFSQFASTLALTNALARYIQALGQKGLLPRWVGERDRRSEAPRRAVAVSAGTAAVVLVRPRSAAARPVAGHLVGPVRDRHAGDGGAAGGSRSCRDPVLQAPRRAAMVETFLAPPLGAIGLSVAFVLMAKEFDPIAGKDSSFISLLPLLVLTAVGGAPHALNVRRWDPEKYAALEFDRDRVESRDSTISRTRRAEPV
ncbi:APC family permease [Modestobacter sp. VKM Ac-2978]|uniref:APC family permease n=1 Tax=Modestobacter sp. VKM Ac-2978 TaxID=3004132 RepID=UPI0022A9FC4C|nr:APC family permease [Modestobacter sp. VKM Ac-2978]MCZ2849892.1 APC family permease [Modestobacter sp. VKM Ac-2978]